MYIVNGVLAILLAANTAFAREENLRGAELQALLKGNNVCEPITSRNDCLSTANQVCSWCKAGAVPDECVPTSLASGLPKSVFKCEEPAAQKSVTSAARGNLSNGILNGGIRTRWKEVFRFGKGLTHTLNGGEVEKDFCDAGSRSLSGFMDVEGSKFDADGEDKHLFYWFFEKRGMEDVASVEETQNIPLIVWLTGGPGCSSTLALLTENGPCKVSQDGASTEINPHSWTETAHMLWLDQPAGVGYSYGAKNDNNEEMVGEDAYYFLQSFIQTHPEYASNPLFIVGESYGGHYAPAIAHRIFLGNQELDKNDSSSTVKKLNLAGVAVGNGMTEPKVQFESFAEMANYNSHGIKTVSDEAYQRMKDATPQCITMIEGCNDELQTGLQEHFHCQAAYQYCMSSIVNEYYATGLNPYDIRLECGDNPLCYDFSSVEHFLNLDSTKTTLHVSESSPAWQTCNNAINKQFTPDWMKGFASEVTTLLEGGIDVLIYAGDLDFVCNYMGNKAWTTELEWEHQSEFAEAEDHHWNNESGMAKTAKGLTFIQVYDAGHMVPSDQPEVALDMIKSFTAGAQF